MDNKTGEEVVRMIICYEKGIGEDFKREQANRCSLKMNAAIEAYLKTLASLKSIPLPEADQELIERLCGFSAYPSASQLNKRRIVLQSLWGTECKESELLLPEPRSSEGAKAVKKVKKTKTCEDKETEKNLEKNEKTVHTEEEPDKVPDAQQSEKNQQIEEPIKVPDAEQSEKDQQIEEPFNVPDAQQSGKDQQIEEPVKVPDAQQSEKVQQIDELVKVPDAQQNQESDSELPDLPELEECGKLKKLDQTVPKVQQGKKGDVLLTKPNSKRKCTTVEVIKKSKKIKKIKKAKKCEELETTEESTLDKEIEQSDKGKEIANFGELTEASAID